MQSSISTIITGKINIIQFFPTYQHKSYTSVFTLGVIFNRRASLHLFHMWKYGHNSPVILLECLKCHLSCFGMQNTPVKKKLHCSSFCNLFSFVYYSISAIIIFSYLHDRLLVPLGLHITYNSQ